MTADRNIPFPTLPRGVTEADVAEIISPPRLLTADRREQLARIEALLAADAAWQPLIADLRTHAGVLSEPIDFALPTNLARGVESRLNELALQELLAAEQSAQTIPISKVQFGPTRTWRSVFTSAPARGLAVAACLVLVVGGGFFLAQSVRDAWPGGSPIVVAQSDAIPESDSSTFGRGIDDVSGADAISTLAAADGAHDALNDPLAEALHTVAAADAFALAGDANAAPMTPERALALAAEGRLAIRVTTLQPERMTHRLNGLARDPSGPLKRIRPESTIASAYASLMAPRQVEHPSSTSFSAPGSPTRGNATDQFADGSSAGAEGPTRSRERVDTRGRDIPSPLLGGASQRWVSVEALYEIAIAADADSLDRITAALRRQSAAIDGERPAGAPTSTVVIAGVELIELDEPARADDPLSMDPREVLWWTGSTPGERWLNRLRVPVVVETVR